MSNSDTCGAQILECLSYKPAQTVYLVEATGAPYHTVYRALTDLEERGVVRRTGTPRRYVWRLTRPVVTMPRVNSVWQLAEVLV